MKKLLEKLFKRSNGKSLETRLENLSDTDLRGIPGYLVYPNDPLSQRMFASQMQEVCDKRDTSSWKVECTFPSEQEALLPMDTVPPGQVFGSFFPAE